MIYLFILLFVNTLHASEKEPILSKKEKLTNYLTKLVSLNTLTANQEANAQALQWVKEQLSELNLHFNFHEFNGYHSLVITTQKTKKPLVWLMAHIDVVAGTDSLFHPIIKDQKMYGRGAYDMKMAIACYLLLMHELKDQLGEYDFGIMLTSDEEIGGMNGVKCLLEEGYSSPVALLPDGGFDWNFEEAAKGVLHVKVISHGNSAHSSRPWNGENAIHKLMSVLHAINTYFEQEKPKNGAYYPTANLGFIQGGKGVNQVPDYAEAKIDIRYPPSMTAKHIYESLQEIIKTYQNVLVEKMIEASPNKVDLNHMFFQKFRELAKDMHGIQVGTTLSHGSSDARFFGERNIPVLVIAPKGGDIHGDNEWVDLDDLTRFYEVMKQWIIEVSSKI